MEPRLRFTVRNQIINRVDNFTVVEKSRNYLYADFEFLTDDWGSVPVKTAIFQSKSGAINVLLENDSCIVPWEAINQKGEMRVSVFGGDLITVTSATVMIRESGYGEGTTPQPPTEDIYDQIIKRIGDNEQYAKQAAESERNAKKSETEANASAKSAGDFASEAKTASEKAVEAETKVSEYKEAVTELAGEISKKAIQISEDVKKAEQSVEDMVQAGETAEERIRTEGEKQVQNVNQVAENTLSAIRGMGVIDIGEELKEYCTTAKENIKEAIINKGGNVENTDSLNDYAERINGIPNGVYPTEDLPQQTILTGQGYWETKEIVLRWTDVKAFGYLIVRKEDIAPTSTADGIRVYKGNELNYTDKDVEAGRRYYYRIFPYNSLGQYQAQVAQSICYIDYVDRKNEITIEQLHVDDVIKFGEYRGENLKWVVCDTLDKDKGYVTVTTTERIGPANFQFDAPENDTSNPNPLNDRKTHGNNRWLVSNIRQFLNSEKPRGEWFVKQHEYDVAPNYANTYDGFLIDFTSYERKTIIQKTNICDLATVDGGGSETSIDTIWLASAYAIGLVFQFPLEDTHIYEKFADKNISIGNPYWTRSIYVVEDSVMLRIVTAGGGNLGNNADASSNSVRPFCLLPTSAYVRWSDKHQAYIFPDDTDRNPPEEV